MPNDEIVIDPNFFIPPNVINLKSKSSEDGLSYYDNYSPTLVVDTEEGEGETRPMPPTSFTVVSQQVRTTSSGRQVVDIILDLPDQPGVREYEIRVAKTQ